MNFTKLVLGDALGDLDLGGLSLLGFEEDLPESDPSQASYTEEFRLPVQYKITNKDADLTEHVYKFSSMFMPEPSDFRQKQLMLEYLRA
jgi:hypothetical protein